MLKCILEYNKTMPVKKIAIYVDVQNIYYTCRQAFGKQFNYRACWDDLNQQAEIIIANAYAIDRNDNKQKSFQKALTHIGFNVKLKPYIQRSDGSAKGDWDVGIAIDILDIATQVDEVILLSGDGDFDLLLNKVNELKAKTMVISVEALTAKSLIDSCQHYKAIDSRWLM